MDEITTKDRREAGPTNKPSMAEAMVVTPKDPWPIDVDVYLEDVTDPDNPKFRLETCLQIDENEVITFYNRGRPGFEIKFNLFDETGEGYRFPPQSKRHEALWSRQGAGCPPDNYGQQWREFEVVRVKEPDQESLIVRNLNETVTEFGYTLRVTKDDGTNYVNLDPGGNNQNGSDSA